MKNSLITTRGDPHLEKQLIYKNDNFIHAQTLTPRSKTTSVSVHSCEIYLKISQYAHFRKKNDDHVVYLSLPVFYSRLTFGSGQIF